MAHRRALPFHSGVVQPAGRTALNREMQDRSLPPDSGFGPMGGPQLQRIVPAALGPLARVAQLAEQPPCKRQVLRSTRSAGLDDPQGRHRIALPGCLRPRRRRHRLLARASTPAAAPAPTRPLPCRPPKVSTMPIAPTQSRSCTGMRSRKATSPQQRPSTATAKPRTRHGGTSSSRPPTRKMNCPDCGLPLRSTSMGGIFCAYCGVVW